MCFTTDSLFAPFKMTLFVSDQTSTPAENYKTEADSAPVAASSEAAKPTDNSSNVQLASRPQVCTWKLGTTECIMILTLLLLKLCTYIIFIEVFWYANSRGRMIT